MDSLRKSTMSLNMRASADNFRGIEDLKGSADTHGINSMRRDCLKVLGSLPTLEGRQSFQRDLLI